jgi:hypothetical protein
VPTNVNKSLLFKEFLLVLVLESLGGCFKTEAGGWLDESSSRGQFTALFQFVEVLIEFRSMLWI